MSGKANLITQQFKDVTVVTVNDTALLDAAGIHRLGQDLFELVDRKARRKIVLDFSSVKFLSSSALGILLDLRKKATAIKGVVILCGIRPELHKVFKITNLNKLFQFFDTEEAALNSFGIATGGHP